MYNSIIYLALLHYDIMITSSSKSTYSSHFAGIPKEDIKIRVDGNVLTLSGEKSRKFEQNDPSINYRRTETSWGHFSRSVQVCCSTQFYYVAMSF